MVKVTIKNKKNFEIWLTNTPKGVRRGLQRISQKVATELKRESSDNVWRGDIQRDTKAEQVTENQWIVTMPLHGIYLDRMKPHWVTPYKTRDIYYWAEAKGPAGSENWPSIYVRPHPFINKALDNSARNRSVIRREIINAIKQELAKVRR